MKRELIADINEEAMLLPLEFDAALIGFVESFGKPPVALYDRDLLYGILIDQGMSYEEGLEWFENNILGAYVGEGTPSFATIFEKV